MGWKTISTRIGLVEFGYRNVLSFIILRNFINICHASDLFHGGFSDNVLLG